MKEGFTCTDAKEIRPRAIIFNVPSAMNGMQLDEELKKNMEGVTDTRCVTVFRRGRKDQERNHAVVEVTGEILRKWHKEGRVYVGLDSCRVEEFAEVTRCYNCHGFGHVSNFCKQKEKPVCGHCAKEGHVYKDCSVKATTNPECVNSKRRGIGNREHEANDRHCPEYVKATETLKNKIDYA